MSVEPPNAVANAGPLAVVCGGGSLPIEVARAAQRQGRRVVLLALRGSADPQFVAAFPHHWVGLGQFGHACRHAKAEGCRVQVRAADLQMLLDGVDLDSVQRSRRYRRPVPPSE